MQKWGQWLQHFSTVAYFVFLVVPNTNQSVSRVKMWNISFLYIYVWVWSFKKAFRDELEENERGFQHCSVVSVAWWNFLRLFWGIGKSKHTHTSSQGFSLCPLSHRLTYAGHALNCWAAVVTVTITTRNEWRGAAQGWNASSTFGLRCRVKEEKWAVEFQRVAATALPEHGERMKVRGHFVRNSRWFGACCPSAHIESICQAADGFLLSQERGVKTSLAVADLGSVVPRQITSAAFTRVVVGWQVIWSRSKVQFNRL